MIPKFMFNQDVYVKEYVSEEQYNPDTNTTTNYLPIEIYDGKKVEEGQKFRYDDYYLEFQEEKDAIVLINAKLQLPTDSQIWIPNFHNEEDEWIGELWIVLKTKVVKNPLNKQIEYTKCALQFDGNQTSEDFGI